MPVFPLKVFISQPMNGISDELILKEHRRLAIVAHTLFNCKFEIINPFPPKFEAPKKATPLWYLGKGLELMSQANAVIFAKGWQKYRGCRIEHACAFDYGIRIIEL